MPTADIRTRRITEFNAGADAEVTVVFNTATGHDPAGESIGTLVVASSNIGFRVVEAGSTTSGTLEVVTSGDDAHATVIQGLRVLADQLEALVTDAHAQPTS